jgi:hypothetical protein
MLPGRMTPAQRADLTANHPDHIFFPETDR